VRRLIGRRRLRRVLLALTAAAEAARSSAVCWVAACSSGQLCIFLAFLDSRFFGSG
jgi:hypothetical protein